MSALVNLLVSLENGIGRALLAGGRGAVSLASKQAAALQRAKDALAALPQRTKLGAAIAAVISVLGFGAWDLRDGPVNAYEASAGTRPLLKAKSWYYHLDKIDIDSMRLNSADVVVMDHAQEGGKAPLTQAQLAPMKTKVDGSKRAAVISYISVGEAEDYRWYWQPAWSDPAKKPDWLGDSNCAWPDNYAVKYWHPGWKKLMFGGPDSLVGRVIKAGFDGVYLDRVDMFDHYKDERPTAEADMVDFVVELAAAARAMKPGFLIIAQNGEDLLLHKRYRRVIDGLGKEDLLHGSGGTGVRNKGVDIAWSYERIQKLQADYKPIFAVEYLVTRESIADARGELRSLGLVPTFAHRNLDGSDPTMPRFEKEAAVGTPEFTKAKCEGKKSW
jgi:cysteinyl-tRNA synthetase, unknown class